MSDSSEFVPFNAPSAQDGGGFVPASYARPRSFVSLFDNISANEPAADFIPDLGIDLEEEVPDPEAVVDAARAEGRSEAAAAAQETIDALTAELEVLRREKALAAELLDGVETLRRDALAQASQDLTDLALAMARRVVGDSIAMDPSALLGIVTRALDRLPGEDIVTVRVRPEDLQMLEGRLRSRRAVKLLTDPDLEGGCLLEADFGMVDASLEAAMEGLSDAVHRWRMENQR